MKSYLMISGTVFTIVALLHLVRLITGLPVVVLGWTVPLWVSVVGLLFAGWLGLWAFRLGRVDDSRR